MNYPLQQALDRTELERKVWQPQVVALSELDNLVSKHPEIKVIDHIDGLVEELFKIAHPSLAPNFPEYQQQLNSFRKQHQKNPDKSKWVYYPWLNTLVRVLDNEEHGVLRTARNRNLITAEEQARLAKCKIGVAGMSVGSSVTAALSLTGSYASLRLADADIIELSNLNRIRGGVQHLGLPKVTLSARGVYELDPFAQVEVFDKGLTAANLEGFLDGLDVVVDEMDDLALKTKLRLLAKAKRIPVIMVTDDGDDCLLDVERFDTDPDLPIFHGLLNDDQISQIQQGSLAKSQWLALSLSIIGADYFPTRLAECLPFIGRSLAGVPQLGSSSMVAGAIAAYAVRMILTGQPIKSGKTPLPIEESMMSNYNDPDASKHRATLRLEIKNRLQHA